MSLRVSEEEVREHLAEYLDRAERGEEIVVTRDGRPAVQLRPCPAKGTLGELARFVDARPHVDPADAAAFGEDIAAARRELNETQAPDPWQES